MSPEVGKSGSPKDQQGYFCFFFRTSGQKSHNLQPQIYNTN